MMKYIISIVIISMILCSCSNDSSDDSTDPQNDELTIPKLVYPTNNLLCIDNALDFEWEASTNTNQDAITYQIDVAKDNEFSEIVHTKSTSSTIQNFTLEKGLAYYWRVRATTDNKNLSSDYSSTFNLFTEGEGITNHLPFSPVLVKPMLNSIEKEGMITLEWTASDTDNDSLVFDVYFDTTNPPMSIVATDQSETVFTTTIAKSTTYYWKIVVKDNHGGQSTGQVWSFLTN